MQLVQAAPQQTVLFAPPTPILPAPPASYTNARRGKGKAAQFLVKLERIVSDPSTQSIVTWAADGRSFVVLDSKRLQKEVLGKFFRSANYQSFQRQLHFCKSGPVPSSTLRSPVPPSLPCPARCCLSRLPPPSPAGRRPFV